MSLGTFQIGKWLWGPQYGNVKIKYASAAENQQIKSDGQDDARQTFKGRKVRQIHITIEWRQDYDATGGPGPKERYARSMLTDISPAGPNAGKPFAWVEDDAKVHNVNNVTVDELEQERSPGTGSVTATLKLSSWVKPAVRPSVTATPTAPKPWSPTGSTTAPQTKTPPGFTQTPVKVTP